MNWQFKKKMILLTYIITKSRQKMFLQDSNKGPKQSIPSLVQTQIQDVTIKIQ